MVRVNPMGSIPPTADGRLDELAEILARGVLRLVARKTRFSGKNALEIPAETRLSVTTSNELGDTR